MTDDVLRAVQSAAETQERVLLNVAGVAWEGHVAMFVAGMVVAVARRIGSGQPLHHQEWPLEDVKEVVTAEQTDSAAATSDDDDELFKAARGMVEQAREYEGLSLAERLLRDANARKGKHDGGCS